MQVLTYMEFTDSSIGRDAFIAYQKAKESAGAANRPGADDRRHPQPARRTRGGRDVLQGQPLREGSRGRRSPTPTGRRDPLQDHALHPRHAADGRPPRQSAASGSTTSRGSTSATPSGSGASATPTARCGRTTCSRRRRSCASRRRRADGGASRSATRSTVNGSAGVGRRAQRGQADRGRGPRRDGRHAAAAPRRRRARRTAAAGRCSTTTLFTRLAKLKLVGHGRQRPGDAADRRLRRSRSTPSFSSDPSGSELDVTAMDPTVLMHLDEKVKPWPNMKDSDVASAIFSDASYSFTPVVESTQLVAPGERPHADPARHRHPVPAAARRAQRLRVLRRAERRAARSRATSTRRSTTASRRAR